jgi:competence protein ComGB
LTAKAQQKFVKVMLTLIESGFSLKQATDFLIIANFFKRSQMSAVKAQLTSGSQLTDIFSFLGFKEKQVGQLELSLTHGNLNVTLKSILDSLQHGSQHRKKLIQVGTYPLILLAFLIAITLGLRRYLLPQLEGENWATSLVMQAPTYFLGLIGMTIFISMIFVLYFRKKNPMEKLNFLVHLPILKTLIKNYQTAFLAKELSLLFQEGLDLREVTFLLQGMKTMRLLIALGNLLEESLMSGQTLKQALAKLRFLNPELCLIIETGELRGNLAKELEIYAEECENLFFHQINQLLQFIQPLVFMLVALVILCIYAAMLLPMYQNMEGIL